jgi:hypothetical protein
MDLTVQSFCYFTPLPGSQELADVDELADVVGVMRADVRDGVGALGQIGVGG